jgi:outer membrane receptor protein involved in Fe transport
VKLIGFARRENAEETRTFIETKDQVTRESTLGVETRWLSSYAWRQNRRPITLAVGIELQRGSLDSDYYEAPEGVRGQLTSQGETIRRDAAGYFQAEWPFAEQLDLHLGARYDYIDAESDDHESTTITRTMSALSPKLALNYRWRSGGNAYLSLTQGFRAPTLRQLFDQRRPAGFDLANPDLEPQYARSVEIGIRRAIGPVPLSSALFHTSVRDEIEFDLETFTYENIGKSLHRGAELRIGPWRHGSLLLDLNYAYLEARFAAGTWDGNQIDNTPRHVVNGRLGFSRWAEWALIGRSVHRVFLDEANQIPLRGYTVFDFEVERPIGPSSFYFAVRNILDREYAGTGYVDGRGQAVVFPAAGRGFMLGARLAHQQQDMRR